MTTSLAVTGVTIVEGDREATVRPDMTILIGADGTIEAVGPAATVDVPTGVTRIDGAGLFAMPGIINAHAHAFSEGKPLPSVLLNPRMEKLVTAFMKSPFGRRYLHKRTVAAVLTQMKTGVTTIRTVGDVGYEVVRVAEQINRGDYLGPRVIASGPLMAIPGGHGAPQIALVSRTAEEARRNTQQSLARGVTAIKISATGGVTDAKSIGHAGAPEMSEEDMRAICDEAHQAGVLVAAHAQSSAGILAALRAGVDTIEHGAVMTDEIIELFRNNPRALQGRSALIPTLQACVPIMKLDISVTGVSDINRVNAEMVWEEMLAGIRAALDNDIALGMGTDSALTYVTHYNTWRELDYLVRFGGVSPARALHMATQANAQILGLADRTGAIAPGLSADIVLTAANPLEDLRTLAAPRNVIVRGTPVPDLEVTTFAEIDAMLDTL